MMPASICFYLQFKSMPQFSSHWTALVSSLSHSLCSPNQPAKQTAEPISKSLAEMPRNTDIPIGPFPRKSTSFVCGLWRPIFPLLVESGPHFQDKNKPWLQKITKALSQKVTQACREHLHSTAGAEIRAGSSYFSTFTNSSKQTS